MKATVINIVGILVWIIFGHFDPANCLFLTPFYIPLLFFIVGLLVSKGKNMYLYIGYCLILLLVNDLLFRFFGGGIHDDAGRAWCEVIFYTTFSIVTIFLLCLKLIDSNQKRKLEPEGKLTAKTLLLDIIFTLSASAITLLIFSQFNIGI